MTRWKAAAIHLSMSAAIGLVSAALIFGLWYPPPYSHAAGADRLVLLLMGVDLVLGPLLTLIVYKAGKKGLRFDLAVIGIAQLAALSYGLSVVIAARPVFLVAVIDRFNLVAADEIAPTDLAEGSAPEFRKLPWTGPQLVGAEMPTERKAHNRVVMEAMEGKDLQNLPRTWVAYDRVASTIATHAKPLDVLERDHPEVKGDVTAWMASNHGSPDAVGWLPVIAPNGELAMLVDRKTGKPLRAFEMKVIE